MKQLERIDCAREAQAAFTYDDGSRISFIWGRGSHTENQLSNKDWTCPAWESHTVEAYSVSDDAINAYLEEHYGEAPATVPIDDIPKILNDLRSL